MKNYADNYSTEVKPAKELKALLKWAGGKTTEFKHICKMMVEIYGRYIEPFAGGAGVCFAHAQNLRGIPIYLNDKCADLMDFYQCVKLCVFNDEFVEYGKLWVALAVYAAEVHEAIKRFYQSVEILQSADIPEIPEPWEFAVNAYILVSLRDKIKRIKAIEAKENIKFDDEQLLEHTETAIRAAVYMFFRAITNDEQDSRIPRTVAWFFVREFSYCAMFRFNSKGKLNVPYGGTSYNRKNILAKIEQINSRHTSDFLSQMQFSNMDFSDFFDKIAITADDFLFLDPPYDSKFSDYDNNAFGKQEHQRLRDFMLTTPARWMLVIARTDFVHELYGTIPGVRVSTFDKKYQTNIKNRGNRDAQHIIYTNYG